MARSCLTALTAALLGLAAPAFAQDSRFFQELDSDGNGVIDQAEFDVNKGKILYDLDKNRSLGLEQNETRLSAEQFRRYAGSDNTIDGLELFDMPGTRFEAFDHNGDQKITREEFNRQLAALRGPQAAEGRK